MRVLVTGGTGFIGSHTVAALRRRGHAVTVLARTPERVEPILSPLGCDAEVHQGDMTDARAIDSALEGCDAVIHCAGKIAVGGGTGPTGTANVDGVRTVIGRAVEVGIGSMIYTSSITVLLPTTESILTADSPFAEPLSSYGASKLEAERLVQGWQTDGAPVTSFNIGGVYGPTSPNLNGSFAAILGALDGIMFVPPGGLGVVDVRDISEMLARAAELPGAPRRLTAGGPYVTWAEWTETLSATAGIPISQHHLTADEMIALGRQFDDARRSGAGDVPLSEEAAVIMSAGVPTDDSDTLDLLQMTYRSTEETFRDTIDYLRSVGHLRQ